MKIKVTYRRRRKRKKDYVKKFIEGEKGNVKIR